MFVAFLGSHPKTLKALKPLDYSRDPKTLAEYLLRERRRRKLYQKDVAKLLGVPLSRYIDWEISRCEPIPANWPIVLEYLEVDPLLDTSTLKGALAAYQRRSGLTQFDVCGALGIHRSTLSYWLANWSVTKPPASMQFVKFEKLLADSGISISK